ncbi:hypothetical protein BDV3_004351 [Batrachochytrium dendrobatidis]
MRHNQLSWTSYWTALLVLFFSFVHSQTTIQDKHSLPHSASTEFHVTLNTSTFIDYTCTHGECVKCPANDTRVETLCNIGTSGFHEQLICSSPLINGTLKVDWVVLMPHISEPHWRACIAHDNSESWGLVKFEIINIIGLVGSGSLIFMRRRWQRIEQYRRLATRSTTF